MLLHAKLSLFAYVISEERSANRPKQLRKDAFHIKASQSAKNQLDPAKNENGPKFDIRPFCKKPFNYYMQLHMFVALTNKYSIKILCDLLAKHANYCTQPLQVVSVETNILQNQKFFFALRKEPVNKKDKNIIMFKLSTGQYRI